MLSIKQGQLAIALVCVVLGFMLAVQFKTTQDIRSRVPGRVEDLSQRLMQSEKDRTALTEEVHRLRQASGAEAASKEMELIKMEAGIVPVKGQGVVVTVDDSKREAKPGENPNIYLVHDDDMLKVINELRAAGAEAISINDQRLITSSEIRCAGNTLSVNNTHCGRPYEIKAIGDGQTLENALKMRGGVVESLQFWGIQINISRKDDVQIPAYTGAVQFKYATPNKGGGQ